MQNPFILAVETSGRLGSVAVAAGRQLLAEARFSGPMRHSAELFPAVHHLLEQFGRKPAQIEHIYISIGPGSFTGIRIATALAKTMHLANAAGVPPKIVAVDSLDVIAANAADYIKQKNLAVKKIAAIVDAKRGQFFIAVYKLDTTDGIRKKTLPDSLMTASQFLEQFACKAEPIWLLGEALVYYKDKFKADGIRFIDEQYWSPQAGKVHLLGWQLAQLGRFADPLTLTPTYLRKPL